MPYLASKSRLRSYSYSYFSKTSVMRQRHEAIRATRLINFFAAIFLTLFILFLAGLVEMRLKSLNDTGLAPKSFFRIKQASAATKADPTPLYGAKFVTLPAKEFTLRPLETATVKFSMENVGHNYWRRATQYAITLVMRTSKRGSPLFHQSWYKIKQPARLKEELIKPKEVGSFEFIIEAPKKPGSYKESFEAVTKNGKTIKNSRFTITINVVDTPKEVTAAPTIGQLSANLVNIPSDEPNVRIGLFKIAPNEPTKISYNILYDITRANGELIKTIESGRVTTLSFNNTSGKYIAQTDTDLFEEITPIRLIPKNILEPATIITSTQLHQWSPTVTDNRFRGVMEIRYSPVTGNIWIINQLPIEYYLKGLGEASDNFNHEYLKTLYTAARTYATFHYLNPYKHKNENFTVDAVIDQVYRGYNQEQRAPRSSQAIDETRGLVVSHNNEVVITPYYSQSDGRTRSWTEVWGGKDKPWLASVSTPTDQGKALLGHGVGMSASAARAQAQTGSQFQDILKYFYTGTELKKLY